MSAYKYLIAYLGQKKDKELKSTKPTTRGYIEMMGFENYTPEVIAKLKELFDDGIISSYPRVVDNSSYKFIEWRNAQGNRHRDGDLPAIETEDRTYVEYLKNGICMRENGPAKIWRNERKIYWSNPRAGGVGVYVWDDNGKLGIGRSEIQGEISKEQYIELIKAAFPLAGDKIFSEDWQYEV